MSAQEGTEKGMGSGCCQSIMDKCFNPESKEGKAAGLNFGKCEEMMKQFCKVEDGKFDFETCRSKMEQCCAKKE